MMRGVLSDEGRDGLAAGELLRALIRGAEAGEEPVVEKKKKKFW